MEMQQVRYFVALVELRNFTRAAEACNVTQPAFSRAIQQLEHELGGQLISREGRLNNLTELGQRMLPLLRQCHDAALSAKQLATKVRKGEVPSLSLGVSRSFDLDLLMGALTELERALPGLRLKLHRQTGPAIVELLRGGELDLAIGGPLGENWDRLDSWPMFSEAFDLVVGEGHDLARGGIALDVDLIARERLMLFADPDSGEPGSDCLDPLGLDCAQAHRVSASRDLEALTAAGFGVTVAPNSALRSPRLRHLPLAGLDLTRTVAAYSVAGRPRSRETAVLLNLVRAIDWSAALAN